MRIALVSETYPPQINGVSATLERLAAHLSRAGDEVLLLVPRYAAPLPELPPGVRRREFAAVPLPFYREVFLPLAAPGRLERELRAFAPDLVHIATEGPFGWAALRAARSLGVPTVSSYHTNFPHYFRLYGCGFLEPAAWGWLRRFHNATLKTFCPTVSIRNILEKRGFRNVAIWSRGVDAVRFHPSKRSQAMRAAWGAAPDETVLAYAGRLAPEKNLAMLIQAWRLLPKGSARLLLIGDGPLRVGLEMQNDEGVIFAGYRVGEELARTYASADLFVFPSVSETFGNVILEGMASGLPAVGFYAPGPADIIENGVTGRLVETLDAPNLARAIETLIGDRSALTQMARSARAYAESQSWEEILGRLREHYLCTLAHADGALNAERSA